MAQKKKATKSKIRDLKAKAGKGKKRAGLSDKELDNVTGGIGKTIGHE
jgi:bacteriocin-like protein